MFSHTLPKFSCSISQDSRQESGWQMSLVFPDNSYSHGLANTSSIVYMYVCTRFSSFQTESNSTEQEVVFQPSWALNSLYWKITGPQNDVCKQAPNWLVWGSLRLNPIIDLTFTVPNSYIHVSCVWQQKPYKYCFGFNWASVCVSLELC